MFVCTIFRTAHQTQATVYNDTVGRRRASGATAPLTGAVITETLTLFAALKYKQCGGERGYQAVVGVQFVAVFNATEANTCNVP